MSDNTDERERPKLDSVDLRRRVFGELVKTWLPLLAMAAALIGTAYKSQYQIELAEARLSKLEGKVESIERELNGKANWTQMSGIEDRLSQIHTEVSVLKDRLERRGIR